MTMAVAHDHRGFPYQGEWTTDDLYALPEDGIRRELVDGVLIEMASPSRLHQTISGLLMAELYRSCPTQFDVTQAVNIRFDAKNSRCPDLLVVMAATVSTNPSQYQASDVVLAVEIVSPSTRSQDRFAKPIQYGQAGIPYYWRIDLEPHVIVNTFTLDDSLGQYVLDHEFAEEIDVDKPWGIRVPFKAFVPKLY